MIMKQKTKFKQTEIGITPEDWEVKELKEVASYINEKITVSDLNIKNFVSTENMLSNKEGINDASSLPKIGKTNKFKMNDVLFSNIRTYFKKLWLAKFDGGCSNDVLVIRSKIPSLDHKFLYYFLSQDIFFEYTVQTSKGTKMPRGDKKAIMDYPINIPPFSEQQSIVKILSDLDSKIELNRQMNKTLEVIGQAIFKHWFIDFEFPNEECKPYKSSDGKMIDSDLGETPESWTISSLGQLHDKIENCVITGPFGSNLHASDYRETGTPLILVKHVKAGRITGTDMPLVGIHKFLEMNRYLLKIGDIVFTRVAVVGESAYIHKRNENWMISGQMLRVRANTSKINPRYLAQVFQQKIFKDQVSNYAVGSTRPSLNTKLLLSFKFVLPPLSLQKKFSKLLESIDARIENNLDEIDTLSSIRDSILPKLMSGKIRIPVEVR